MSYEDFWSNGLLVSLILIVAGSFAIPFLRTFRPHLVAAISVKRNTQILAAGICLLVVLIGISLIRTSSPFGMMSAQPKRVEVQRTLSDSGAAKLKEALLTIVPRDKPVVVLAQLTHAEGCRFAKEIYTFLKSNGFTMKETEAGCDGVVVPIPYGVAYRAEADEFKVIVGFPQR
jgi:hypothetical protein